MGKRSVKTSDINKVTNLSAPLLSPDGMQLLFLKSQADTTADEVKGTLRVCDIDGANIRDLTASAQYLAFKWAPDGKSIGYIKIVDKKPQLFMAPMTGGDAIQLTKDPVNDFSWSPDASEIVLVRNLPKNEKQSAAEKNAPQVIDSQLYKRDGTGFFGDKRQHLVVLNLKTQKEKQITRGDWHCTQPAWNPDGKSICFVSDRSRGRWNCVQECTALWLVASKGGRASRLTPETGASSPRYSPDGKWIAYVGQTKELTAETGEEAKLIITDSRGKTCKELTAREAMVVPGAMPHYLTWRPDSKKVKFIGIKRGASHLFECTISNGSLKQLSSGDREISGFACKDDQVWMTTSWLNKLQEIATADIKSWQPRTITKENGELSKQITFSRTRRVTYRAKDGWKIEGFLIMPPGYKAGRKYPLLMNIHGGPHGMHPRTENPLINQAKAAAGYMVFLPNPRGSISYGDEFMRAVVHSWGQEDYEDLMSGVDHLISQGLVDSKRLHVEGYSYGGFMSSWIVGHTKRFKSAVIGAPLTDLISAWATSDINTYLGQHLGGAPHDNPETFRQTSPLTYVKDVRTPVLLAHWSGDTRCPPGQSEQFYMALKTLKRKAQLILYPGGSHGGRTPSQNQDFVERSLAWHKQHT